MAQIQGCIPEIIKTIDKISSHCVEDGNMLLVVIQDLKILYILHILGQDTMIDQLQNSVKRLNKLCKSTQIIRKYSTGEDSIACGDEVNKCV